jgi:drug/metabolite transporter (DMT)-like permease
MRQSIAGVLLIGFMVLVARAKLPRADFMLRQAIGGFFMISCGNGLVAWAEVHIPSGIAAIICSMMPMLVILINVSFNREERPNIPIALGVVLGLAGIVMIFGEHVNEFTNQDYLLGIIMTFVAIISWAIGSIMIKKHNSDSNPFLNAGLQMFFGGLFLFPASLAFDNLHDVQWTAKTFYALSYLIAFGSIIAYASYMYSLRKLPMTIVSLYAYVNPLVAVVLGWVVLNEKLNLTIWIAILITIAGIYIVNRGYQLRNLWKTQLS